MATTKITVAFDAEKLAAIQQFAEGDAKDVDAILREQLEKIYTKAVPAPVRQYIEGKVKSVAAPKAKTPPKHDTPQNTSV